MAPLTASPQLQQLLEGPALAPPAGIVPNFENPPNLNTASYSMAIVAIALPTIVVALRLYTKVFIVRAPAWEDWVTVLAWSLYIPYCAYTTVLVRHGAGLHQWDVQLIHLQPILYDINVLSIMYGVITFLVKFSILLQYLSIFSPLGLRNLMWWSCWGLSIILFVVYMILTWVEIFLCNPRDKFWTPWLTTGHCMDANSANISAGIVNSVADLLIILLPQRSIWKLSLHYGKKIRISAIFLLALFALTASVIRCYYAFQLANSGDTTYNVDLMGLWTYAEFTTTFICSCMPSLAALGRHLGPTWVAYGQRKGILSVGKASDDRSSQYPSTIGGHGERCASVSELGLVRKP